jgi:hypothetical protein
MYVDTLAATMVDETEYELIRCDPDKPSMHYEVQITRRDAEATAPAGQAGIIIGNLSFPDYDAAQKVWNALVSVAIRGYVKGDDDV